MSVAMIMTAAFAMLVSASKATKQDLGQDKYSKGLPEGDGTESEQCRKQVVPQEHDSTSENKNACRNGYGDEYGSLNPKARSSLFSTTFHNL
jgi:hypothetical protein